MIRPKNGVVEGVEPGGIAWLRLDSHSTWLARVGSALTPITRRFVQRDRCGTPMRHRQEHGKARARDGRTDGDRGEIERDQSAPQAVAGCLPRKEIATL